MDLQGVLVQRVSTALKEAFSLCSVVQEHMYLSHMPLTVSPVCLAGTVWLALFTFVQQKEQALT